MHFTFLIPYAVVVPVELSNGRGCREEKSANKGWGGSQRKFQLFPIIHNLNECWLIYSILSKQYFFDKF